MIDETAKELLEIMKEEIPEKKIAEYFLWMGKEERKITKIGYVKDIDSNHKNEFFEEIFKDENEKIVDIRFLKKEPSQKELEEMSEYWWALQIRFKKRVDPIFILLNENYCQN